MADRETGEAPRTGRERLRKLTQAALTADETVDQVQEIPPTWGQTMASMDTTLGSFDYSLGRVTQAMDRVDGMADQLESLMVWLEGVVSPCREAGRDSRNRARTGQRRRISRPQRCWDARAAPGLNVTGPR